MKKCPMCSEEAPEKAVKCLFCGQSFAQPEKTAWYFQTATIVIAFLSVGPFALPLVWRHPTLSRRIKTVITLIACAAVLLLGLLIERSVRAISSYYTLMSLMQ